MIPIRFGAPSRQLFGLYQVPHGSADRAHCVVVCNPFGQEAIRCHRMLRVLGERLARAGFHVLRFDYYATGDSDGDDGEADFDAWVGDVTRADAELRRLSGHAASSWFGLRLGATLAALASARASVDQLVLWDPVVDGKAYLDQLAEAQRQVPKAPASPAPVADGAEALGFPIPPAFRQRLEALQAPAFAVARAARATVLGDVAAAPLARLGDQLRTAGMEVAMRRLETQILWASDEAMNTAIVPPEPLQAIAETLGAAR